VILRLALQLAGLLQATYIPQAPAHWPPPATKL
jgi:hypothetical protein